MNDTGEMGLIEGLAAQGKSRAEIVAEVVKAMGIGEVEANFIVAVSLGEIEGDVVTLDETGAEIPNSSLL